MNILETKQLSFAYKNKDILKGIDLMIPKGSIYGYLGKNGAGKTTTIKLLLGLLSTKKESIFFDNKEFNANRVDILSHVGSLIESPCYYDDLKGGEHLEYLNIIFKQGKKRIQEVLEIVGLSDAQSIRVKKYSTGMKQRLGIAMAIFHNPDLLILDEPLNGLDPAGVHDIREIMMRLKNEGKTILLSSHILGEIEKTCTHIGILDRGDLLYQGELSKLLSNVARKVEIRTNNAELSLNLFQQNLIESEILNDFVISARLNNDKDYNQAISLLVNNQVDIYSIDNKENDLESVYLNIISK